MRPHSIEKCGLERRLTGDLEVQLDAQLNITGIAVIRDFTRAPGGVSGIEDGLADLVRRETRVDAGRLRMIEDVESFQPELEANALREIEILEERDIPVVDARAPEGISPDIAYGTVRRTSERRRI